MLVIIYQDKLGICLCFTHNMLLIIFINNLDNIHCILSCFITLSCIILVYHNCYVKNKLLYCISECLFTTLFLFLSCIRLIIQMKKSFLLLILKLFNKTFLKALVLNFFNNFCFYTIRL